MSIAPKQTQTQTTAGNSLKRDSRAASVFEPRQHPRKSWVREWRKIINKKIWGFSPNFRHVTYLESINRFLNCRKCAPNYAEFMTNNSFRISKNGAKNHERSHGPQATLPKEVTFKKQGQNLVCRKLSPVHRSPFALHRPPSTVHRPPSTIEVGQGESCRRFQTSLMNRRQTLGSASRTSTPLGELT